MAEGFLWQICTILLQCILWSTSSWAQMMTTMTSFRVLPHVLIVRAAVAHFRFFLLLLLVLVACLTLCVLRCLVWVVWLLFGSSWVLIWSWLALILTSLFTIAHFTANGLLSVYNHVFKKLVLKLGFWIYHTMVVALDDLDFDGTWHEIYKISPSGILIFVSKQDRNSHKLVKPPGL